MSLTAAERAEIRRWVEQTTTAQGLPLTITDPATLAKVAALAKPAGRTRDPTPA